MKNEKVRFKSKNFYKECLKYGYIKDKTIFTIAWISFQDDTMYYQLKNSHILIRSDNFEIVEEL